MIFLQKVFKPDYGFGVDVERMPITNITGRIVIMYFL